jgi:lactate dehydrogenase-like 2-hydroxyacid dehydrogenase
MRPGSILVNAARGQVVDGASLAVALTNGPLGAAGLDVFENEPEIHPALLACPNAVFTPHMGSADRRTREAMVSTAIADLIHVLRGERPDSPVVLPSPEGDKPRSSRHIVHS